MFPHKIVCFNISPADWLSVFPCYLLPRSLQQLKLEIWFRKYISFFFKQNNLFFHLEQRVKDNRISFPIWTAHNIFPLWKTFVTLHLVCSIPHTIMLLSQFISIWRVLLGFSAVWCAVPSGDSTRSMYSIVYWFKDCELFKGQPAEYHWDTYK